MAHGVGAGPRRVTISDIAARAGVSKVAVSYALNGNPGLSDRTRRRILAIAKEIGWHPNYAARALSASRASTCGMAFARPALTLGYEPFFWKLLSGIETELSANGMSLMLQIVEDVHAETEALRRWWAGHRVDGVLLVDLRVKDPRIETVEGLHLPTVIVGGPGDTGALPYLPGNDTEGIRLIVSHLAGLGHVQIDRVAGSSAFASVQQRTRTFRKELARVGAKGRVLSTDYTSAAGAAATRKLLCGPPAPTAIVFDNDIMAVAGLGVAQEMGIAVPEALSIVSFEDSVLCEVVRPSLTACTRDVVAYGASAARSLMDLIAGKPVVSQGEQASSLACRASTASPPRPTRRRSAVVDARV